MHGRLGRGTSRPPYVSPLKNGRSTACAVPSVSTVRRHTRGGQGPPRCQGKKTLKKNEKKISSRGAACAASRTRHLSGAQKTRHVPVTAEAAWRSPGPSYRASHMVLCTLCTTYGGLEVPRPKLPGPIYRASLMVLCTLCTTYGTPPPVSQVDGFGSRYPASPAPYLGVRLWASDFGL